MTGRGWWGIVRGAVAGTIAALALTLLAGHAAAETPPTIALFSDCEAGQSPPSCGDPPARWGAESRPVAVCSVQTLRPSWISAAEFRQLLSDATSEWNRAEVPLGIRYTGDCPAGVAVYLGDGLNTVGFIERALVSGHPAAATVVRMELSPRRNPTVRRIIESDIGVVTGLTQHPACLRQAIVHEFGHMLGLGHSTDPADSLYPTLPLSTPQQCRSTPSARELARLQDVYGVNRLPTAEVAPAGAAFPGERVVLSGRGVDPDGDAVSVVWRQVGGPPVTLAGAGTLTPSFTATAPGDVTLMLVVTDPYLHETTTRVTVQVVDSASATGPVPARGFGLFAFAGGSSAQLLAASGCPGATAAFWVTDARGDFVVWVPGTTIAAVNAPWLARYPAGLPANTAVLARCRV